MWALDPIDGTKGFLRGEQFAVCLALIVDAKVQLGVIGCPNLSQDGSKPDGPRGCMFVAVRGQGAEQMALSGANPVPMKIPAFSDVDLNMLESVEAAHSSHSFNDRVSKLLGITRSPTRMDSQAKYCALSRGDGGIYLRLPATPGYVEKIWDHAPGSLLVEEAGGMITDAHGLPLNFGLGRELRENHGVVAAGKPTHGKVLAAVKQALEEGKPKV
jgi:3'(2'), 5'-bisphosphate nucleotidase